MTNINLLISGAQLLMNILNLKQQLLTGTFHSNTFFKTKEDPEADQAVQLSRSSKEVRDFSSENYYQNPLLNYNSPDPGVVRLEDGSGWALVTTTNDVTRKDNTTAFPIYFSKGNIGITCYMLKEKTCFYVRSRVLGAERPCVHT